MTSSLAQWGSKDRKHGEEGWREMRLAWLQSHHWALNASPRPNEEHVIVK